MSIKNMDFPWDGTETLNGFIAVCDGCGTKAAATAGRNRHWTERQASALGFISNGDQDLCPRCQRGKEEAS